MTFMPLFSKLVIHLMTDDHHTSINANCILDEITTLIYSRMNMGARLFEDCFNNFINPIRQKIKDWIAVICLLNHCKWFIIYDLCQAGIKVERTGWLLFVCQTIANDLSCLNLPELQRGLKKKRVSWQKSTNQKLISCIYQYK